MYKIWLFFALFTLPCQAEQVLQTQQDFLIESFKGDVPKAKTLWLKKEQKQQVADILQHDYSRLRVRYWARGNTSLWILEEIGKESPITVGLHVQNKLLKKVKVLVYRESRGDEVKYPFFTNQFIGASLTKDNKLSKHIDGITGATLSVRALTKLSRMALWLDTQR